MHDKPQTFLTVVDKTSVHRQVLHDVAICVRSFEFTTGDLAGPRYSERRHWLDNDVSLQPQVMKYLQYVYCKCL